MKAFLHKHRAGVHKVLRERPQSRAQWQEMNTKTKRPLDERSRRTQQRLGMALIQLIQERPGEEITVKEVLDRASVGRSTFYLHFRDKEDLLFSQLEQFLEMFSTLLSVRKEKSKRVVPVREMFEHIAEQQKLWRALVAGGAINDFFDLAQDFFTRGIELRLKELNGIPKGSEHELRIRAVGLAGNLLSLLRWWIERGAKEPATEMDRVFHAMVWDGMK
jgi:AcrR family transcriptional regulator